MHEVIIKLNYEMFSELQRVSEDMLEMGFTPERCATEMVESALASRRLPRVKLESECW